MTTFTATQKSSAVRESVPRGKRYTGSVVYIYAYDVAYEMNREPLSQLLGQKVEPFAFGASKRSPRHLFFYKPQMIRLPEVQRMGPLGAVNIERVVKLLSVGALSVTVRVPFEVDKIEDLVVYHDLQLDSGALTDEIRSLAEQVRSELQLHYIKPVPQLAEEEAYTVFCLEAPLTTSEGYPVSTENWLQAHRRQVASLLTQEAIREIFRGRKRRKIRSGT